MTRHADADIVIVGSGVAGLSAALAAAERGRRVLLLTAGEALSGSSWCAQGGIAAAVGPDDDPALQLDDTLSVGAGLNDRPAVQVLVEEGRRMVSDLLASGVPFDRASGPGSAPQLGLEAGHSRRRILHAWGGATGSMLSTVLYERARDCERIEIVEHTPVERLLIDNGSVVGAASGEKSFYGPVLLATGGYAGLWGRSTNPAGNRGIGIYLSWVAGATLADLEFVQFHPTALSLPGAPAYLLSEALRGDGALLLDEQGEAVVNPLLPRDVVARAIARHLREKGPVYLSLRHLDPAHVEEHFSSIARYLRRYGLDLARDLIPVAPAAHYCMGGVRTDTWGRTNVPGLYAAGEVACTGVQGANRLASNSLLECLVFGARAAAAAASDRKGTRASWPEQPLPEQQEMPAPRLRAMPAHYSENSMGLRLDEQLGVERDGHALGDLVADLPDPLASCAPPDHTVAALAARSALLRTESRGGHYRTDFPDTRPEWRGRILWRRDVLPSFEEVPTC